MSRRTPKPSDLSERLEAVPLMLCECNRCNRAAYCDIHDAPDYDKLAAEALAWVRETVPNYIMRLDEKVTGRDDILWRKGYNHALWDMRKALGLADE